MEEEIIGYFGNFINYLIFVYVFVRVVSTSCFSLSDMSIALAGLVLSVFINVIFVIKKRYLL